MTGRTDVDWEALRAEARRVAALAYAPYSRFPVGAAALVDDGRVVSATNVENASYGLSTCAECGVAVQLHATGGGRLVAIAVVDGKGEPLAPVRPLPPGPLRARRPRAAGRRTAARGAAPGRVRPGRPPVATVDAIDLIVTKRDGGAPHRRADRLVPRPRTRAGSVGDEQASALLMAILFRGLDDRELARWTEGMIASGTRLDLSGLDRPTVDKHSTGGVGDKVSLVLCPLVAACGAAVPQTAGRGLGHTGGTLDKLEAIPGGGATSATRRPRRSCVRPAP